MPTVLVFLKIVIVLITTSVSVTAAPTLGTARSLPVMKVRQVFLTKIVFLQSDFSVAICKEGGGRGNAVDKTLPLSG